MDSQHHYRGASIRLYFNVDPTTLEVARNRFSAVADAMEALLRRHYHASTMLEGGVSLGHSDPGFTLRVYAHLMPWSEERARTVVDMSLSAAAESSRNDRPSHVRFVNH